MAAPCHHSSRGSRPPATARPTWRGARAALCRPGNQTGADPMYALLAIALAAGVMALLNLIEFKRID
jgi:hypothetical protein